MTDTVKRHRIVIGATSFADACSVIDIGCFLAESTQRDIQAVLIEEETVYALSALPSARVTLIGGQSQPVTPAAMIEAFRRDAVAYEKAVRESAAKRALHWSFEKRRGEFPRVLNEVLSTGDLIVFGYQALRRARGEILVVDYANDMDVSLVELASSVSREMHLPLHVVLLRNAPDAAILVSDHARSRMQRLSQNLTIMDREDNIAALLDSIRRSRVATVMISAGLAADVGLDALLDAARCPVIIYSS
jgi:hypothetical protein